MQQAGIALPIGEQANRSAKTTGFSSTQALEWSKDKSISDILDLMISLEANTFDLYLKLGRQVESHQARKVFVELAEKEKIQLNALIAAFEKNF